MSTSQEAADSAGSDKRSRAPGAFDIRTFIALLIGIYGLVLIAMGLVSTSDSDLSRADGINVNLWAGLGMAVVAALLVTWARLRPLMVAEVDTTADTSPGEGRPADSDAPVDAS